MTESNRSQLIASIYEVVLSPEHYDRFMELWADHLAGRLPQLIDPDENQVFREIEDDDLHDHFQRAFEIMERGGRSGEKAITAANTLAALDEPAFLIDAGGSIVERNERADIFLGAARTLSELEDTLEEESKMRLQALSLSLGRPGATEQVGIIRFRDNESGSARPNRERTSVIALAQPRQFTDYPQPLLLVTSVTPEWSKGLDTLLAETFAITPSEGLVLKSLCNGESLEEIAQSRARSIHTIRAQVKTLLSKTGTQSQVDLVRLVLSIAAHVTDTNLTRRGIDSANILDHGDRRLLTLSSGQEAVIHEMGDPNGHPVIFVHGMLDGIAATRLYSENLKRAGLRVIAPVRPGFGSRRPYGSRRNAPEEFCEELREAMDLLDIERAVIVGHMSGALYAFAAASRLSDRIGGLLAVSGGVPITSTAQFRAMAPRQRVVAFTSRYAPQLLRPILRAGISQIDSSKEEEFMASLHGPDTHDGGLLKNNLAVREAVVDGYHFAVAQGPHGFEVDAYHVVRDWSRYVSETRCPCVLMHGRHDPVVALETVVAHARRYQHLQLRQLDDCGQLLFYEQPRRVVAEITRLVALSKRETQEAVPA